MTNGSPKNSDEMSQELEKMRTKMAEMEAENQRLKNQEQSRQNSGNPSKSKIFTSRIKEAGSFRSIIKNLNFSDFSGDMDAIMSNPDEAVDENLGKFVDLEKDNDAQNATLKLTLLMM
jgi:hypothetical protein